MQVWGEIRRDDSQFPINKITEKQKADQKRLSLHLNWDSPVNSKINYDSGVGHDGAVVRIDVGCLWEMM